MKKKRGGRKETWVVSPQDLCTREKQSRTLPFRTLDSSLDDDDPVPPMFGLRRLGAVLVAGEERGGMELHVYVR